MTQNNAIDLKNLDKEKILSLLNAQGEDLINLMKAANAKRETNHVTYSKNVFIPLTEICRNDCGYCAFKKSPDDPNAIILKDKDEVVATLKEAEKSLERLSGEFLSEHDTAELKKTYKKIVKKIVIHMLLIKLLISR